LGLLRLAQISPNRDALAYLDRIVKQFPDRAPEALEAKAKLLNSTNAQAASQTWQTLLNKYPKSDEAADYRWLMAQRAAKSGDYAKAWQWAQPIAVNNSDSQIAPKAAFWVGKWAQKLGKNQEAKQAFTYTISRHPHSYYAWRSAVLLGWDVGDFTTVRSYNPTTVKPATRNDPPAGSEAFKELYRIGEDTDAWNLWQAEIVDPWNLTVDEQFNLGVYKLSRNQNLEGINLIWRLRERDTPTWYLDYTHGKFAGNSLFAVASYNAGPGAVSKWRQRFDFSDPDEFVENIPFRETKGYIESVFGNYWNYLQIYNPEIQEQMSRIANPS